MKISDRLLSHFTFASVGLLSLVLAVFLASQVTKKSHSQEAPGAVPGMPQGTPPTEEAPPPEAPQDAEPPTAEELPTPTIDATQMPPSSFSGNSPNASPLTNDTFLEPYIYDMRDGRRNPFKPPVSTDGVDIIGVASPLERFEINELKLIGIMWDVKNPRAMIQDPGGIVHTLTKDDRIGRKRGYIAMIREGEVVVVETTNFGGENQLSTTIMRIDK